MDPPARGRHQEWEADLNELATSDLGPISHTRAPDATPSAMEVVARYLTDPAMVPTS